MEMIGLAFVVVLIVLGIMFALVFQTVGNKKIPASLIKERHAFGTSLETAMLETTIPDCGYPLSIAIRKCLTESFSQCGDDSTCYVTHAAITDMLNAVIGDHMIYNATLEQNGVVVSKPLTDFIFPPIHAQDFDCENIIAHPSQSIPIGTGTAELSIAFCN